MCRCDSPYWKYDPGHIGCGPTMLTTCNKASWMASVWLGCSFDDSNGISHDPFIYLEGVRKRRDQIKYISDLFNISMNDAAVARDKYMRMDYENGVTR